MQKNCEPGHQIQVIWLGRMSYRDLWQQMRQHAEKIANGCAGELIWLCEHEPVYTTGRRGIDNRRDSDLPAELVYSDRGGETTFHGPGQLMLYPVIHLRQRHLGVKQYVRLLEQSCINVLTSMGVHGGRRCGFPGVWTGQGKIAALGIRVSRGVAYHGIALNVDVDPSWFAAINPCGLQTDVVNLSDLIATDLPLPDLAERWQACFVSELARLSAR